MHCTNRLRGLCHTPHLGGRGRLKAQLRRSQNPDSVLIHSVISACARMTEGRG
ncbi:hypothetical protein HMPREF9123_0248 [Neisseria bacilliformis ATCC BAA-1200]|uniref:Uncharacterized protein n=1 Tax=Neisseria bacilliformis ATCC BAA-1200 TaxID=888742 RepID=F2B974_9NEIS|nr:hypothetical protein HMPREF9123_0248 [Neisseria bacilliformis ATCC BAA-1200]